MTQESAPMPERDVSPATEAGRGAVRHRGLFGGETEQRAKQWVVRIEQEAAAIERRKVVERAHQDCHGDTCDGSDHGQVCALHWRSAILDEPFPPSSDREASR